MCDAIKTIREALGWRIEGDEVRAALDSLEAELARLAPDNPIEQLRARLAPADSPPGRALATLRTEVGWAAARISASADDANPGWRESIVAAFDTIERTLANEAPAVEALRRALNHFTNLVALTQKPEAAVSMLDAADLSMTFDAADLRHMATVFAAASAHLRSQQPETEEQRAEPLEAWNEEDGPCLWWKFPIVEPPYCGSPLNEDFPDYVTHWTPIAIPALAKARDTEGGKSLTCPHCDGAVTEDEGVEGPHGNLWHYRCLEAWRESDD